MISPDAALVSRVARTVLRQCLFRAGDTLVVALSGGADSAALLDILSRLPHFNLNLIAAHVNHCLRGAESDADQEFCRELASRHGIPFEARRIDARSVANEKRLNLEDAGRQIRIEFLDEIRRKYGATRVVLAHHSDDQAETVLMRLIRGAGMTGLSGMAYRNSRDYVRPLLDITRFEIEQYLRRRGLEWREDASNSDTIYLRNRIRHQLLPLLEEYNPAIRSSLAATASTIRGDEALLNELTEQAVAGSCRLEEGKVVCSVDSLNRLNPALRRRVLRHVFNLVAGTLAGLSLRHIDAVCDILDSTRPNSRVVLPHSVMAVREYGRLVVMPAEDAVSETGFELLITEPGSYQLPGGGSLTVTVSTSKILPTAPDTACFDLVRAPFPWLVRPFRPGDRIVPFGMSGRKKVKEIFIDRKIPQSERTRIPLLFCGTDLLWIAGISASELCRLDTDSTTTVQVLWRPGLKP